MSNDPKLPTSGSPSPGEKAPPPPNESKAAVSTAVAPGPKPAPPVVAPGPFAPKDPGALNKNPITKNTPSLSAPAKSPITKNNPSLSSVSSQNSSILPPPPIERKPEAPPKKPSSGEVNELTGSFNGIDDMLQGGAPKLSFLQPQAAKSSPNLPRPSQSKPPPPVQEEDDLIGGAEEMTGSFTGLDPILDTGGGGVKSVKVVPPKSPSEEDGPDPMASFADLFNDKPTEAPAQGSATARPAEEKPKPESEPVKPAPIYATESERPTPTINTPVQPPAAAPIGSRGTGEIAAGRPPTAVRPTSIDTQTKDPLIGSVLLHYRIQSQLAEGGMGIVYKAEHVSIHRQAAVKVLKLDYCRDEGMVQRFYQEGRLVNQIRHENIIDIFDFGKLDDGRVFYIMEFLEGETLAERLSRKGPMPFAEAYPIMEQALRALRAVHEQGVIHRDLKPDNFWLIQREGAPPLLKILDFGIAKLVNNQKKITKTGSVMGTPQYMSPEQLNNQQPDVRSDVYALGVVFYEMFAGDTPFGEKSIAQIVKAHLEGDLPPLPATTAALGVPAGVRSLIARSTALNPEDRYPSMADLLADLTAAAQGKPLAQQTATYRAKGKAAAKGPRSGWLPWAVPAALFGVLTIGGITLGSKLLSSDPAPIVPSPPQTAQTKSASPTIETGALRDSALSLLRKSVTSKDPRVRAAAALALGGVGDKESRSKLLSLLSEASEELEVRVAAAQALGLLGDAEAREGLTEARKGAEELLATNIDVALFKLGDAAALKKLQSSLRSRTASVRFAAAVAISETGDAKAALSALRAVEPEGLSPEEALTLAKERARVGDKEALESFKKTLLAENEAQRLLAASILARLGSDIGRGVLVTGLNAKDAESQILSATSLLFLGDFSGVEQLKAGLTNEDAVARRKAAQGLAVLPDEALLPLLSEALSDQDPQVQIESARAVLEILGLDPTLLARAGTAWIEKVLAEDDTEQKLRALRLAKGLSARAALPVYKKGLADEDERVKLAAAKGLATLSRGGSSEAKQATEALRPLANEKGVLGVVSQGALAASGDAAAQSALAQAIKSPNKEIRLAALEAASNAGRKDLLSAGLNDKDFGVRFEAATLLASRGDAKGAAILQEGLKSNDTRTRTKAYMALRSIGQEPDSSVADPAILIASSDPKLRVEAANLAAEGKGNPTVLRKALYDPDPEVRIAAIQGAAKRKDTALLRIALKDPNPEVRASAEIALASLAPEKEPEPSKPPTDVAPQPEPPVSAPALDTKEINKISAAKAKMGKADLALASGKAKEALSLYTAANKMSPQPDIQWYYGECYRKLGDAAKDSKEKAKNWEKAKTAYEKFAKARKSDARAGKALKHVDDLGKKLAALKK